MFHCSCLSVEIFCRSMLIYAPGFSVLRSDIRDREDMEAPARDSTVSEHFYFLFCFFKIFFLKHNIDWESSFLLILYCAINFVFIRSVLREITKEIFDLIPWHFYQCSHYSSLPWSNKIIITWIKGYRRT